MCLDERNTDSRARPPAARLMVRRTRPVRRSPRSFTVAMAYSCPVRLLLLALLAEDELLHIFDAFAFVRLWWPVVADIGGNLPDLLLVDAGHDDLGRLRGRNCDAVRDWMHDVVAVAERDLQVLALHRGTVTDAGDLQAPLEALGDAGHQIGDQSARGAPQRARDLGLSARVDLYAAGLDLDGDIAVQHQL